jgi:hypothetical protein
MGWIGVSAFRQGLRWRLGLALAGCAALAAGRAAHAAPEEIQVYMDDMSDPGRFGLDVHVNYVGTGYATNDYPGQQQSLHRLRVTPEFAYGVTPNLELGLYLPLATLDGDGRVGLYGLKLRAKYIAPKAADQKWFWGANLEVGGVTHQLDQNPYNAELKGIVGIRSGRWTAAFNANVDFKLSGPAASPASLDLDTKLSYALTRTLAIGVETYNGAGPFRKLGDFGHSDGSSFVTIDKNFGRWDVNFGIGSGYGSSRDRLILKAIVGVPID